MHPNDTNRIEFIKYFVITLGIAGVIFALLIGQKNGSLLPSSGLRQTGKTTTTASAQEIHQDCESKAQPSEKFDCYEQVFWNHMKANGARKTLELLDDLQKIGGYAHTNCHPLVHKVGNIALHVYGSVPKAVPEYSPVCYSGYYHGLLEEYLATAKSYEQGVVEVCGKVEEQVFFNWFQCTHGLGHGVMQFREDEVLVSLKDCDLLPTEHSAREICYAGVFMENITTDEKTGHPSKYIQAQNPIYPCDIVETQYKSACYFLSSSQILKVNGWNFADGFRVCDTKAEENYRWLCYQSMGRDVSGSTQRSIQRVNELCSLGQESFRGDCFFGAVRDFINEKGQFDTAIDLCQSITDAYESKCWEGVFLDLGLYYKGQEYLNICQKIPQSFRETCNARMKV